MRSSRELRPVCMEGDRLVILDQRFLPNEERYRALRRVEEVYDAIRTLAVRGAPAIGVAAAYGMWLAAATCFSEEQAAGVPFSGAAGARVREALSRAAEVLISARPTAVNLAWAVRRMEEKAGELLLLMVNEEGNEPRFLTALREEADAICREDEDSCRRMGEYGLSLLEPGMGILTHCNAGILATAGCGTALAPLHLGQERGYGFRIFADETRPLLQGARLTAWELMRAGADVTLICDNMAAQVMKSGRVDAVLVGCDRMAANGDGANKIGTAGLAVLAKEYGIPFYMFAPTSTIDLQTATGEDIVIEERDGEEIRSLWYEKPMAPEGVRLFDPAFDVTESRYLTAIVTERGIVRPPWKENLAKIMEEQLV